MKREGMNTLPPSMSSGWHRFSQQPKRCSQQQEAIETRHAQKARHAWGAELAATGSTRSLPNRHACSRHCCVTQPVLAWVQVIHVHVASTSSKGRECTAEACMHGWMVGCTAITRHITRGQVACVRACAECACSTIDPASPAQARQEGRHAHACMQQHEIAGRTGQGRGCAFRLDSQAQVARAVAA